MSQSNEQIVNIKSQIVNIKSKRTLACERIEWTIILNS